MKIRETIVVEGRDDLTKIRSCLEADVIITHGYGIRESTFQRLEAAYKHHGIIILTDPDRAGELIRERLYRRFPQAKHAFLSRTQATKEGDVGIENASCEDILQALQSVRTPIEQVDSFTVMDLFHAGLNGREDSAERRNELGKKLGVGYANAAQFLRRLNLFGVSREEFERALQEMER